MLQMDIKLILEGPKPMLFQHLMTRQLILAYRFERVPLEHDLMLDRVKSRHALREVRRVVDPFIGIIRHNFVFVVTEVVPFEHFPRLPRLVWPRRSGKCIA